MLPVTYPTRFQIGTRGAFKNDKQYEYLWDDRRGIFTCGKTTAAGLAGEILAMMVEESPSGNWYVAVEGRSDANFEARRPAFRTQEKFWNAGWNEWQENQNDSGGHAHWDIGAQNGLHAETKVARDAGTVDLLEGLQQLAITN
jgi:hypothetical protein